MDTLGNFSPTRNPIHRTLDTCDCIVSAVFLDVLRSFRINAPMPWIFLKLDLTETPWLNGTKSKETAEIRKPDILTPFETRGIEIRRWLHGRGKRV